MRWLPAILILVLFTGGCPSESTEPAAQLPAGWPLAGLTAPPGAQRHRLFALQESLSSDGGYTIQGALDSGDFEGELWALAFESSMSWSDIRDHAEDCLRPLGYSMLENPIHGTPSADWPAFQYISPDGLMLVVLARSLELSGKNGVENVCMYKLTRLNQTFEGTEYRRAL